MCVDRAGIVGADGNTHQGLYDLSFFKVVPNLTIVAPKDYLELKMMMEFAITVKKPVVIRYPRGSESDSKFLVHDKIKLGKSEIIKTGNDITLIGMGKTVSKCLEISNELEKSDIDSEVINVRFLKPIDEKKIIESISKTKRVVIIEDSTIIGGLSSTIKEIIINNKLSKVEISSYAYPDKFIEHGSVLEIEKKYGLDNDTIIDNIKKYFNK